MRLRDRIVFPLDVGSLAEAQHWVRLLAPHVGVMKVGLELFIRCGPDAVRLVHDAGIACFLDLKLHDIPATMRGATESAVALGVRYLTVHAAAGPRALCEVVSASRESSTTVLAVTVLTSMDDAELGALGLPAVEPLVASLVEAASASGVGGFVCSAHEVQSIRARAGTRATLVVPGIRPRGAAIGDQRRTMAPREALRAGADLLVIGRPIREASDPVAACAAIAAEMEAP